MILETSKIYGTNIYQISIKETPVDAAYGKSYLVCVVLDVDDVMVITNALQAIYGHWEFQEHKDTNEAEVNVVRTVALHLAGYTAENVVTETSPMDLRKLRQAYYVADNYFAEYHFTQLLHACQVIPGLVTRLVMA